METQYYDGTKLLSMLDINGNRPEIYMCTSNRSAGKTTYFSRLLVNRYLKTGKKFGLIYRYNYELDDCAEKFFKEIGNLFFSGYNMTSVRKSKGIYHELFLNDKSCGYAISLNNADQIKKLSHLFSDIEAFIFDEFQSETNHYCNDEVKKFISVHVSIARGKGEQSRYLPVYMLSNPVSIINPYYVSMGISNRLQENTNFLRGKGFVLEQGFNESASNMQKESAFNQAFANDDYIAYSTESIYLNDNQSFIEKPKSDKNRYIATLKYKGNEYGIREYSELGIVYCDNKADRTYPFKISVTTDDHSVNYVMLKRNDLFISNLRYYFEHGCFRFHDLNCKEAVLKCISY